MAAWYRREVVIAAWSACVDMYVHQAMHAFSNLTAHNVRLYSICMCMYVLCHVICRGVEAETFSKLSVQFKLQLWIEGDRCQSTVVPLNTHPPLLRKGEGGIHRSTASSVNS